jgi:coenzyme F420-reducing hydrogenase delta subunit
VLAVKKALSELDVEAERIEMFHLERGFHPEFVSVAQEMDKKIQKLGPSPLKGESE